MTLSEKYPGGYFDHCLAMFVANNREINQDLILEHIDLYIYFEGEEEFAGLKKELISITENDDLKSFINLHNDFDYFNKEEILKFAELILAR